MSNIYIRREGNPDCAKVDRWLGEIRSILRDQAAAVDSFAIIDEAARPDEAAAHPHGDLPAFFVQGALVHEGPISKRGLLGLLQDETRRMQNEHDH